MSEVTSTLDYEKYKKLTKIILNRYKERIGSIVLPVNINTLIEILEEIMNIKIELRWTPNLNKDSGSLFPVKGGFIITYNFKEYKNNINPLNPNARVRYLISHELAHTLFYNCEYEIPKLFFIAREYLIDKIARELILPEQVLKKELFGEKKDKNTFNLIPQIRKISRKAGVGLKILSIRIIEDLNLLDNTIITFWIQKKLINNYNGYLPISKISNDLKNKLSKYWRNKIYSTIWKNILLEALEKDETILKKSLILKSRKKINKKIKTINFDVECESIINLPLFLIKDQDKFKNFISVTHFNLDN